MLNNSYGKEHMTAREEAIAERGYQCQVTGKTGSIEAHHSQPRYLGGPDHKSNYVLLEKNFHQMLHDRTWSEHNDLIAERAKYKKMIIKEPTNEWALSKIREIDEVLMLEYIQKLMGEMPHNLREKLIESTLYSSFETIRDLTIQILVLRKEVEALQNESKPVEQKLPRKKKKQEKRNGNILPFKRRS